MSDGGILNADLRTVTVWLSDGWRWWIGELAELVPLRLRDWLAARRKLADYDADTGEVLLRHNPDARYPTGYAPVAVILPPDFCLTRTIERPELSPRDLDSMITLDCDRILPLAATAAVVAARVIGRDEAHRRMSVEVAAIPRGAAENLAAAIARMPRPCLAVYQDPPERGAVPPVDFLPALRRAGLVTGPASTAPALWLIVAFLFALNIGLLVWRDMASVDALAEIAAQQTPAVNAARRIEARISGFDRQVLSVRKHRQTGEPLAVLSRVGIALPPGVWLQRFTWADGSLRLAGYRPALTDVSAALRRAGFAVTRYSETAVSGNSKLGQPFEVTLRLGKPS